MKKTLFFIMAVLVLISCAVQAKSKKDKKPDWLENPKSVYSEQLYLTAIGEGDSRNEAENYAAGNLAKIFETRVQTDETYSQRYQELMKGGKTTFEEEADVQKMVNLQAEQTLYNVQFSDSYTDQYGRVHVLAYLNRFKTGELYEEKINTNADRILFFLDLGDAASDPLMRYAAYNAAKTISLNNEILLSQLDIISPDTKEFLDLGYNHDEIVKMNAMAAKEVKFAMNIGNDQENKIGILIEDMFTDLGFVMSSDNLLLVEGEITFEQTDLGREDDNIFVRYDLQLKVKDPEGIVVAALTEKGREGHKTYLEARERAVRALEKKIRTSLKDRIISYLDSLVL
ncbi:MAG: LPP20 family lipoprotein [Candidatus Cloacimonetes bacterium]|nr:LPP20 family lipoprotein [Candidatus Cloacimonadota bacterium]